MQDPQYVTLSLQAASPSPLSLSPTNNTHTPPSPRRESIPILGIEGIREGGREALSSLPASRPRLPSNINGACGTWRGMHRRIKKSKTRKVSLSSNRRKWGGKANYVLDVPKHPPPLRLSISARSIALEHWEACGHQRYIKWSSS